MADIIVSNSGYATGSIDTATTLVAGASPAIVNHINGPTSAIIQVETVLGSGTDLKGSAADLVARLARVLQATGVMKATPDLDATLTLSFTDSRTATSVAPVIVSAVTSGTPAAGIGVGLKFDAESADESPSSFGQIEFIASDVGAGTEDTYFQVLTRVAGAILTAVYRWVATTAFKAIFTHANSADRTYTLPDRDGVVVAWPNGEVPTTGLKTATGSATSASAAGPTEVTVTMNDFGFFPSFTNAGSDGTIGWNMATVDSTADPGNTTARFGASHPGGANNTFTCRWRYVTSSDDPTIWLAVDALGEIRAVWCSDDPTPDGTPGISIDGHTSVKLTAQDIAGLEISQKARTSARERIRSRRLKPEHIDYRALQEETGDQAPSRWLLDNTEWKHGNLSRKGPA